MALNFYFVFLQMSVTAAPTLFDALTHPPRLGVNADKVKVKRR
jgi:hypothetical protein